MTAIATAVAPFVLEITIADLRRLADELLRQHYAEVTQDKRFALAPDWPTYETMEGAGLVLCLGAFVGGELVGYSLNFVYPRHLHYDFAFAQNDVFFVAKPHRGKQPGRDETIGDRLRAETKRLARERGARKLFWHAKERTAMARWLAKTCRVQDLIYGEDL